MIKKLYAAALFCALLSAANIQTFAKNYYPYLFNERFAVQKTIKIMVAEVTYEATSGNGNFGSLNDLRQADLIDPAAASGRKYGYDFVVQTTAQTNNTPAALIVTATPQFYRKTGRKSFYIDTSGILRGADKNGAPADGSDPIIEICAPHEQCTISNLRTLHSAEITLAATSNNGNYGSLSRLQAAGLINSQLATGSASGYNFTIVYADRTADRDAYFSISAVPQIYGTSGVRLFYIATDGVIHAA